MSKDKHTRHKTLSNNCIKCIAIYLYMIEWERSKCMEIEHDTIGAMIVVVVTVVGSFE